MIDHTVKDMPNFTRCPNPDCNSGQVHEGGESHPLVTCAACSTQFCFRHGVPTQPPSQHENMSCDEYDLYLAEPLSFRSEHERAREHAEVERRELEAVARARERMEGILDRRRAGVNAAAAAEGRRTKRVEDVARAKRERGERKGRAEQQRRERDERKERQEQEARELEEQRQREERARVEEQRFEEERARAEAERRVRAAEIHRRREEEEKSEETIGDTTKGCPRCEKRIEKNQGW